MRSLVLTGALIGTMLVAACGTAISTPLPATVKLTVGLGYISNIQFAQFYRAQQQGYYRDNGLDVTFQNEIDPNLITLVGQGAVDIGLADGTSVIPAVGQGIPIKFVGTIYNKFPNVVMAPAAGSIKTAADLKGHSLGIPGRYGSSWVALQALLGSVGLTTDDITVKEYPDYGQASALQQGQVDSATGFANNEPVQLAQNGFATTQLTIDEIVPLPGPGLIVGANTLAAKHDAIQRFINETVRAMQEIEQNPELGLDDTIAAVPELGSDRAGQLAVLNATIKMWAGPDTNQHGIAWVDTDAWSKSLEFMRTLPDQHVPATLTVNDLVTQEFSQ
ncbi:MAG TPA: ABC transporter substrate-binding protein [Candidatus Limnocylindrales bacterium]